MYKFLTTVPLVVGLRMRLIHRWDHIFSVNNSKGGTLFKVSILSSVFFIVLLTTPLFYYKTCKLVMGGFISRLFRGGSRRRSFGLLVSQMCCQKCTKQTDTEYSCLPSTLHSCSSPERERPSIQQVCVYSQVFHLICFINLR